MARKNAAEKAKLAATKALEEAANPTVEATEDGEPPAKKSKKQQHRKDKRQSSLRSPSAVLTGHLY